MGGPRWAAPSPCAGVRLRVETAPSVPLCAGASRWRQAAGGERGVAGPEAPYKHAFGTQRARALQGAPRPQAECLPPALDLGLLLLTARLPSLAPTPSLCQGNHPQHSMLRHHHHHEAQTAAAEAERAATRARMASPPRPPPPPRSPSIERAQLAPALAPALAPPQAQAQAQAQAQPAAGEAALVGPSCHVGLAGPYPGSTTMNESVGPSSWLQPQGVEGCTQGAGMPCSCALCLISALWRAPRPTSNALVNSAGLAEKGRAPPPGFAAPAANGNLSAAPAPPSQLPPVQRQSSAAAGAVTPGFPAAAAPQQQQQQVPAAAAAPPAAAVPMAPAQQAAQSAPPGFAPAPAATVPPPPPPLGMPTTPAPHTPQPHVTLQAAQAPSPPRPSGTGGGGAGVGAGSCSQVLGGASYWGGALVDLSARIVATAGPAHSPYGSSLLTLFGP